MIFSGINLVMMVIGFAVSTLFIVFVCTRLIWARIYLTATRRSLARASRSDAGILERGLHCLEPLEVSKFPVKKYGELCSSSKENALCTVCLSEYHNEDMLRILPVCGHSFHSACIDTWLHQHITCPVCRISLRDLPERKWCSLRSNDTRIMGPIQERDGPDGRVGGTILIDRDRMDKDSVNLKVESPSNQ
ncbi:E3 ubiquitin-protein ligase ATL59-like isoform X2 [Primulina eburnea]|uniref:E3 ubiquitin-protein ligase ATL59-like isoform X2 n=1 Tax=Primulina eburnea TaxID=1245227 RepID=UPI003C6C9820